MMSSYIFGKHLPVRTPKSYMKLLISINNRFSSGLMQAKDGYEDNANWINLDNDELISRLEEVRHIFDLRNPGNLYLHARSISRHFIYHAGPTNSGKTHSALKAFLNAESGLYCGPLRLLAGEIYQLANDQNIPCDMITGEEKLYAFGEDRPANHIACTVQTGVKYTYQADVAIIDEIQMLRNSDGTAFTQALLCLNAKEIHLCGEESAINIVQQILETTNDTLEVRKYERMSPLKVLDKSLKDISNLKPGDCMIAFRQKDLFSLKSEIESSSDLKCAIVHGKLPVNIRKEQAKLFNSGEYDVLLASDAIGMGLNFNINRIIFNDLDKFDGFERSELTPHSIKQVAGRAGRYNSKYPVGYITSFSDSLLPKLDQLMETPINEVKKASILPIQEQMQLLSLALPDKSLLNLLEIYELLIMIDKKYFLGEIRAWKENCRVIEDIPLTVPECFIFMTSPVNLRNDLEFRCYREYALSVSRKTVINEAHLKNLLNWKSLKLNPRNFWDLHELQKIFKVLDLYYHFYYHFPDLFVDVEKIRLFQKRLENVISHTLTKELSIEPIRNERTRRK